MIVFTSMDVLVFMEFVANCWVNVPRLSVPLLWSFFNTFFRWTICPSILFLGYFFLHIGPHLPSKYSLQSISFRGHSFWCVERKSLATSFSQNAHFTGLLTQASRWFKKRFCWTLVWQCKHTLHWLCVWLRDMLKNNEQMTKEVILKIEIKKCFANGERIVQSIF